MTTLAAIIVAVAVGLRAILALWKTHKAWRPCIYSRNEGVQVSLKRWYHDKDHAVRITCVQLWHPEADEQLVEALAEARTKARLLNAR